MRQESISSNLFKKNRNKLKQKLLKDSIVIINSNKLISKNADSYYTFVQNSDLFYLTGINQRDTTLIIYNLNNIYEEILFIKKNTFYEDKWEGEVLKQDEASVLSGLKNIKWTNELDSYINKIINQFSNIYLNLNEHTGADLSSDQVNFEFYEKLKKLYPLHNYYRLAPILSDFRTYKEIEEINILKKAAQITKDGFLRVLKTIEPGIYEYDIEAEFNYFFTKKSNQGYAYDPIVASGKNACILHYTKNNNICNNNDLVLIDVGIKYSNYNSDVTRTVPINGRFTNRQKEVYSAVLNILKQSKKIILDCKNIFDLQKKIIPYIEEELINLNLFSKNDIKNQPSHNPLYKKYFLHNISHHIGLDVHDNVNYKKPFKSGTVITIEPGIYIEEEGIGVRLENVFAIYENYLIDLNEEIPLEIEEIEAIMNN